MRDAKLVGSQGAAVFQAAYASGVADGDACRRSGGRPTLFLRVALGDAYSAGFRAGYFQRAGVQPEIAAFARHPSMAA